MALSKSASEYYANHKCKTRRPGYCITDDRWFESAKDAARYYGITVGLVSGCCTGNAISTHGKKFTYNLDGSPPEYKGSYSTTRNKQEKGKRANAVPVMCVETGAVFDSLSAAAKYANLKYPNGIRNCCIDNRRTSGGFHWKYT